MICYFCMCRDDVAPDEWAICSVCRKRHAEEYRRGVRVLQITGAVVACVAVVVTLALIA